MNFAIRDTQQALSTATGSYLLACIARYIGCLEHKQSRFVTAIGLTQDGVSIQWPDVIVSKNIPLQSGNVLIILAASGATNRAGGCQT